MKLFTQFAFGHFLLASVASIGEPCGPSDLRVQLSGRSAGARNCRSGDAALATALGQLNTVVEAH